VAVSGDEVERIVAAEVGRIAAAEVERLSAAYALGYRAGFRDGLVDDSPRRCPRTGETCAPPSDPAGGEA
jgi:hypothetical protein